MKKIIKTLQPGINYLCVPNSEAVALSSLFPNTLAGATISKLDDQGDWLPATQVSFSNNSLVVDPSYQLIEPLTTLKLNLKRPLTINWEVEFASHSGINQQAIAFEEGFS